MRQLCTAGIKALRVSGNEQFDEALEGRFRFGMQNIHIVHWCVDAMFLCTIVVMSPEHAVSLPWKKYLEALSLKRTFQ